MCRILAYLGELLPLTMLGEIEAIQRDLLATLRQPLRPYARLTASV